MKKPKHKRRPAQFVDYGSSCIDIPYKIKRGVRKTVGCDFRPHLFLSFRETPSEGITASVDLYDPDAEDWFFSQKIEFMSYAELVLEAEKIDRIDSSAVARAAIEKSHDFSIEFMHAIWDILAPHSLITCSTKESNEAYFEIKVGEYVTGLNHRPD